MKTFFASWDKCFHKVGIKQVGIDFFNEANGCHLSALSATDFRRNGAT